MRRTLAVAVFIAVLGVGVTLRAQESFQFFASMIDASGQSVGGLTADDFVVREDGVVGKVLKVEAIDWPVKVQVLVDTGAGVGNDNLMHVRNGVRGLLEALPEGIEVAVYGTAPPRPLVKPTIDRATWLKAPGLLAVDSGAGRFVDALGEASQRIEKDTSNFFPVIVALGSTAAGGSNVTDAAVEKILKRLGTRGTTVHAVMLESTSSGQTSGANSVRVGTAAAELTGGRYERILAGSRLATLLPEIGQQIAASHAHQSRQYRITMQRPNAAAPLGQITLGTRTGARGFLSLDGHLP